MGWRDFGEADDGGEAGVAAGALEQGDLGAVQVAGVAELFLGETAPLRLASTADSGLLLSPVSRLGSYFTLITPC
ncbi:MAG TPA: hypothetical protein VK821_12070 [Dehalococcoidia bacterium]|nr:hypothetical protein [Dehalococcoidia bacterium]